MFTPEGRSRLRSELIDYARDDRRISAVAITGSLAEDREDRWSDVDLALGIADSAALPDVMADWTAYLYERHQALHHLDVLAGAWIYRVFLLPGTLQLDLGFVPAAEFRALAPSFRLIYGEAREPRHAPASRAADIIGFAWLYAVHARTSIARRKLWQAEYMISGVRDHALALACIRHELSAVHGRGIDELPIGVTAPFEESLVRRLDSAELSRAFDAVITVLRREMYAVDRELADRLDATLQELSRTAR